MGAKCKSLIKLIAGTFMLLFLGFAFAMVYFNAPFKVSMKVG